MSLLDNFPHKCRILRKDRQRDALGGSSDRTAVVQTDVECWEQSANSREIGDYERRGIRYDRDIYFYTDPQVTERHEIVITEREGVAVPKDQQVSLDVISEARPDASAGLGVLWKVMCSQTFKAGGEK